MNKRLSKISRFFLILVLITGWIFSGWPQIFNFPPGIQEAQAAETTYTITDGSLTAALVSGGCDSSQTNSTPSDGGQGTVVSSACVGRNDAPAIKWTKTLTWETMGVTAGNTVTAVNGSFKYRVAQETHASTQAMGTMQLQNSGDTASCAASDLEASFDPGAVNASFTTRDSASNVDVSAGCQPSSTSVTIRLNMTPATGNNNNATSELRADDIQLVITHIPPTITVGTTGTQTSSMLIPSTNQYVGGAFTFIRSEGTANVTAITISETDASLVAQTYLSNMKLFYKTEASCSASIPGDATAFNATGVGFDASENAAITGDSAMVVGTSQICVYVQLNVESGAPNGDTFDIEITDPSTEVTVSAGGVSPATAVAITGATTINLAPAVKQDHYRWRNDDGPQGNQAQTLYFNPTGNGFGTVDFTIVGGTCALGSEWDCVDDDSTDTSSTAPTSDTETSELLLAAATDYYTLADDQLLAGSTITQLDITVAGADDVGNPNTSVTLGYCIVGGANDCGTNDTMGSAQAISGADQTKTEQFTGLSLSTTDLNNMQLVLTGSGVKAEISTLYVLVTYSVPEATWATGAEDQALSTLDKNSNIRLRFQVDNTGGSANSYNYRLEWAARGVDDSCDTSYTNESYAAVPDTATTEHFDMTLSAAPGYVDGEATTTKLSNAESYTFVAGTTVESTSNQSGAITLAQNQYTEVEYVFQANANATDSGVYCFRVTNAGTALDSADVIAQVTLAGGAPAQTLTFSFPGGNTVALGTLSTTAVTTGSHTILVGTNAENGVAVTYSGATLTSGGNTITAMSTAAASSFGTEQFGINAKDNATPNVGAECSGTPSIAAAATGYAVADNFKFVSGETIISSAGSINDTTCTISYIANITTATEPGSYSATLTYVATGNF